MAGRFGGVGWVQSAHPGEVRGGSRAGEVANGDEVLATPGVLAQTGTELLLTVLGLVLAIGAVAVYLRSGRSAGGASAESVSKPTSGASPDETECETADAGAEGKRPQRDADEQRVVDLLEAHGGRMKQGHIVTQTDWSKSKVSMVLSEMEEEGTVSKLRVGRENIVSLAGAEPEAVGSPFEEE